MRKPVEHGDVGGQVEGVNLHTGQVPARHIQLLRVPAGKKKLFFYHCCGSESAII
jgi:hypothetical protein